MNPDSSRSEKIPFIQTNPDLDGDIIEKYLDKENDVFVIATMVKALGKLGGIKHKKTILKYLEHTDA